MRTFNILAIIGVASAVEVSTRGRASIRESAPVNDDFHLVAQHGEEEAAFMEWMNENGVSYSTEEERGQAYENWKRNNATIRELNENAVNSGRQNPAMFNHNADSDKSEAQLAQRLGHSNVGFEMELAQAKAKATEDRQYINIRDIDVKAQTYDWSEYTKPVYSQGSCGSCWAVSGNTVLEGTDYIFNGTRTMLSKQLPVSCQYWQSPEWNDGCDGGDAARMWTWYMNNGTLKDEAYPYSSESKDQGITGECTADLNNLDKGLVTGVQYHYDSGDATERLSTRPLTGAFSVGSGFSFYSHGLIVNGDGNCNSEGAMPNHQMAVVGVDTVGDSVMATVPEKFVYARWKPDEGCNEDEYEADWYSGTCLTDVYWKREVEMASGPYYKIQNSWDLDWGHGGFAYFAIQDDVKDGNCSMFQWPMQSVSVRGE